MKRTLNQAINGANGPIPLLRNSQAISQQVPVVPFEYSNWRREQLSWDQGCALLNLSHHMVSLSMRGEGVFELLQRLGVNSFANLSPSRAKQYVCCNSDGYVIGQGILFRFVDGEYLLVGPHAVINWVEYNLESHLATAKWVREATGKTSTPEPTRFRYQLQGPEATAVLARALDQEIPELRFFHVGSGSISSHEIGILRHGMAAEPGYEIWGDWKDNEQIYRALFEAGKSYELTQVGGGAYFTTSAHSGYFVQPIPAIYSGAEFDDYRDWLDENSYEATAPLGGSYRRDDVADYYFDPFELGYGKTISFDHEFVGADALSRMIDDGSAQAKKKVTLVWDPEDVVEIFASFFHREATPALFMSAPLSNVATFHYDAVRSGDREVGISGWPEFSAIHRRVISIGLVDAEHAVEGAEVSILWGEDPVSSKLKVDAHRQFRVRARVALSPIGNFGRTQYRSDPGR